MRIIVLDWLIDFGISLVFCYLISMAVALIISKIADIEAKELVIKMRWIALVIPMISAIYSLLRQLTR